MCVCVCVVCVAQCVHVHNYTDQRRYEADLERTFKKFSTKPITQVALVAENNLIFMLAGTYVHAHRRESGGRYAITIIVS